MSDLEPEIMLKWNGLHLMWTEFILKFMRTDMNDAFQDIQGTSSLDIHQE